MTTSINPLALLNLNEATILLYKFDMQASDTTRSAMGRTRKRIENAIVRGKIKLQDKGKMQCGVLIDWARQHKAFKNKLNEFSSIYNHETSGGIGFGGAAIVEFEKALPLSQEDCHKLVKDLKSDLDKLQAEHTLLKLEKIKLEADANSWREFCIKNKKSALKTRKV